MTPDTPDNYRRSLDPNAAPTYEELVARVAALEEARARTLKIGDLPIPALQDRLLADWQPSGGELLARGSVPGTALTDGTQDALAVPVMVTDYGGTLAAGAASISYLCNKDSVPKTAAAAVNQVIDTFVPDSTLTPVPEGYKAQYLLEARANSNGTLPGGNWTWGMWQITGIGGGAGAYTHTMAGGFTLATNAVAAAGFTNANSGWVDDPFIDTGRYAGAVFTSAALAANSMFQWRCRLWRRYVPVDGA